MVRPIEPGVQLSGHLVSAEIGRGGYSRVFRAEPAGGGPAVAIKVAIDPGLVHALRAEGATLRRLQSPRFVRILEEHLEEEPPFFVLELCEGGDLGAARDAAPGRRLPPARVHALARAILEGVAFAHDEGVVHGDLKPENILLDAAGEPRIADLGLSRAGRRELLRPGVGQSLDTGDGKVRGTFDYLAPEVRGGAALTPQADVFALGVLLYELLTGERPLGVFRLPSAVLGPEAGVPRALERVIARALHADPEHRYLDAGVMLVDLELGDEGLPEVRPVDATAPVGPNPLLVGIGQASFHDALALILAPAALWTIAPSLALLGAGRPRAALGLVAVVAALAAALVAPHWLLHRARAWWTRRSATAALALEEAP